MKIWLTRMWRWSVITTVVYASGMVIWYLMKGELPEVNSVVLLKESWFLWKPPVPISRWWDIAAAPLWTCSLLGLIWLGKSTTEEQRGCLFGVTYIALAVPFLGAIFTPRFGIASVLTAVAAVYILVFTIILAFFLLFELGRYTTIVCCAVYNWANVKNKE